MKRTYTMPKAKMVRFSYNERITAASGYVGNYGSAYTPDFCQQGTGACYKYYIVGGAILCRENPSDNSIGFPDPN